MSEVTKMTVYRSIYRPILTYVTANLVLNNRLKNRLQATEMKCVKQVKGVTRIGRIRYKRIIEEVQIKPYKNMVRMNDRRPVYRKE